MSDIETVFRAAIIFGGIWIILSLAYWWSESAKMNRYNAANKKYQDLSTYNLETVASTAEYDEYNAKRNAQTSGRIVSGMMFPGPIIDGEIMPEYPALNPAHVPALPCSQIVSANGWREASNRAAAARYAAQVEAEKNHNAPYKVEFFK